ncbi:isoprenylcysteine carboxyl methyltransferase [Nitritalea halalkaliphila LW7]|uniref:Isoprenylcysteine carboxyl methyltransferase n=1 Tax=Nitritalea halalkaliphila LW7 TaxID=1189621 RepID=I5BVW2_9BACT|nr:isoprenylcysteine carboxylmethyltransferase family protein [Nitritalea halalkaliphila]EIM73714.1 isoprenylcysteine carboxyl methyltransferase [Nitritalea halalkaliphila LW7]
MSPYLQLLLLWAAFYASHSLLATPVLKNKLGAFLGREGQNYRLAYSLFSAFFLFYLLLFGASIPAIYLFPPQETSTYIGYMLATFGTILVVKSFKHLGAAAFLGIKEGPKVGTALSRKGLHAHLRHPMYAGALLILAGFFSYLPTAAVACHVIATILYLPIGIWLEERKLILEFGEAYRQYRREVPALLPNPVRIFQNSKR